MARQIKGTTRRVLAAHPGVSRAELRRVGVRGGGRETRLVHDLKLAPCGHWLRGARKPVPVAECPTCGRDYDVVKVRSRRVGA